MVYTGKIKVGYSVNLHIYKGIRVIFIYIFYPNCDEVHHVIPYSGDIGLDNVHLAILEGHMKAKHEAVAPPAHNLDHGRIVSEVLDLNLSYLHPS